MSISENLRAEILIPPLNLIKFKDFISPTIIQISNNQLETYPITLVLREENKLPDYYGFIYASLYLNEKNQKILLITHPLIFKNDSNLENLIVNKLLDEVFELGEQFKCDAYEILINEVLNKELVRPPLSLEPFTQSITTINHCLLTQRGFIKSLEKVEYRYNIEKLPTSIQEEHFNIILYTESDFKKRLSKYSNIIIIENNYLKRVNKIEEDSIRETYGDRIHKKKEFLVFFKIINKLVPQIEGCIFWNPINIFDKQISSDEAKILRIISIKDIPDNQLYKLFIKFLEYIHDQMNINITYFTHKHSVIEGATAIRKITKFTKIIE